ncbi:uncharacterized protein LOC129884091 [Solanum dulcamara]|uniref:uncharacterized protein LOC129884091 n=1 Tax=Solanum dulcamara TaxID=45834 RepID=UPI002486B859|nr:uncharacterized protein LOC129884091 [Solanum dulcamara]
MKESETIKEYSEKLISVANKEQRKMMKNEATVEGALQARQHFNSRGEGKKQNFKKGYAAEVKKRGNAEVKKRGCRKLFLTLVVENVKYHKLGYAEIICKEKGPQQLNEAQIVDQQEEEELFVATCFASKSPSESWLIDSGCTNHMTHDEEIFRELDRHVVSKVKIGNGDYLPAKGKGTIAIESYSGTKLISNVLFVLDRNLLSMGQILENGFKLNFGDNKCVIFDPKGQEICQVKMRGIFFSFDPTEGKCAAYPSQEVTTDVKRDKLDKKAESGGFIGYSKSLKLTEFFSLILEKLW